MLACRDPGKAEAARADIVATTGNQSVSVMALDLGSKTSIRAFVAAFQAKFDRLVSGEYFEKSRVKLAAKASLDEEAQERLWKLTEALAA